MDERKGVISENFWQLKCLPFGWNQTFFLQDKFKSASSVNHFEAVQNIQPFNSSILASFEFPELLVGGLVQPIVHDPVLVELDFMNFDVVFPIVTVVTIHSTQVERLSTLLVILSWTKLYSDS